MNRFSGSDGEEGGVVNAEHGASGRAVVVMVGDEEGGRARRQLQRAALNPLFSPGR